jgi:dTDP-4-dehydrorhamnose reductase
MNIKVLVTGANGQLGSTIKELYSDNKTIDFTFTAKGELDINNYKEVETFFANQKFNYCINCAAYTNVEQAELHPEIAFKANADAVRNLAKICINNETVLIHISTDYVFDGNKQTPYNEADKPNPINAYGKSKLAGETHIQEIIETYFIIRTSWLYSKFGTNFLKTIVKKLQNQEDLTITTSQKGTPTSCIDLSEFIIHLIINRIKDFGLYHFSASGETTWYDYALQICAQFKNYDCNKIKAINSFHSNTLRPKFSILDNSKASSIFKPQVIWKKRVDETVKSLIKSK